MVIPNAEYDIKIPNNSSGVIKKVAKKDIMIEVIILINEFSGKERFVSIENIKAAIRIRNSHFTTTKSIPCPDCQLFIKSSINLIEKSNDLVGA